MLCYVKEPLPKTQEGAIQYAIDHKMPIMQEMLEKGKQVTKFKSYKKNGSVYRHYEKV
jgi:hypothetical protein